MDKYLEVVINFLKEHTTRDLADVSPETKLQENLGLNSLELMGIANDAEDEFNIVIEDEELANLHTIKDLMELLQNKGV